MHPGARPSWVWSSLCQGKDFLKERLRWQVNSGKNIRFWFDRWIPNLNNFQVQSSSKGADVDTKVASFINNLSKFGMFKS